MLPFFGLPLRRFLLAVTLSISEVVPDKSPHFCPGAFCRALGPFYFLFFRFDTIGFLQRYLSASRMVAHIHSLALALWNVFGTNGGFSNFSRCRQEPRFTPSKSAT